MADSGKPRKRRKNPKFGRRKLLQGEKVEIRSIEDGFLGSWHAGVIIKCRSGLRMVRYDHLLCDDESGYLTEPVEVSSTIDGIYSSSEMSDSFRGRIRPFPLVRELVRETICYGLCVDAYYNDAWWEGVIFDHEDGSDNRKVFFPDLGDEMIVHIKDLRIMHDWDEVTAEWKPRGKWLLLEIIEENRMDNLIPVSIKQIWYDLRLRKEFAQIGDWASPVKPLWQKLVMDIVNDNLSLTLDEFLSIYDFSEAMLEHTELIGSHDSPLTTTANSAYLKAVVASGGCGFHDGGLATENEECMTVVDEWLEDDALATDSKDISPSFGVAVPSIGEVVPLQPKALSIICCHSEELTELATANGSEGLCSDFERKPAWISRKNPDLDENSLDSRCKWNWEPENGKLKLKAEFCPESINEYLLSKHPGNRLTNNVRNHLYYLGWKMDCTSNNGPVRIRYTSPEGKRFYTVRSVCENIKSAAHNFSSTVENAQKRISSPSGSANSSLFKEPCTSLVQSRKRKGRRPARKTRPLYVEPEYCPEVVDRYLECVKRTYFSNSKMGHDKLRDKVRKHLSAIGWRFWSRIIKGKDEWRYGSPNTDKVYSSLRSACKAIAEGEECNTSITFTSSPAKGVMCTEELKGHFGGELSLCDAGAQQKSSPQRSKKCNMLKKPRAEDSRKLHKRKKNGFVHNMSSPLHSEGQEQLLGYDGFTNALKNRGKRCSIRKLSTNCLSKKRKTLGKARSCSDGNNMARVLRSSKRVRDAGPPSFSQVPRTILSWLIDNNVISARKKVYYRLKRDLPPIAEGKITREGIRCSCCKKVFTLSAFEAHACGSSRRPAANIFLEDGRSLVECQMEIIHKNFVSVPEEPLHRNGGGKCQSWNDHICSICHYGGELILCDMCPSSFHKDCLSLQKIPEGDWFCPSCCCGICGENQFDVNSGEFTGKSILCCHQCERQYHAGCIRDREMVKLDVCPAEKWFCSKTCEKVHWGLQQLLGKPILVGHNNLTWTLIKPMHHEAEEHDNGDIVTVVENNCKLHVALEVMHECFEPVKEPQTRRDLVEDVIFCRSSHLNRLNFRGFYNVLLERNDELITVATLRVYGNKAAEIPLIGTRFQYRRLGMCRILMNEIEKNLINLGVEKLVLPAAASVLNTWITSFGFSPVTQSERSEFLGYTFLDFQDTVMCQKSLKKLPLPLSHLFNKPGVHLKPGQNIEGSNGILDFEGNSGISEEFQEQVEVSESVDQGAQVTGTEDQHNGDDGLDRSVPMLKVTDQLTNQESEPCSAEELTDLKKLDRDDSDANPKFYKREVAEELRPSIPQADYPKVEVSCR